MGCTVVSMSRSMGSGGEEVGRLVARDLGFRIDDEIVIRAAERADVAAGDCRRRRADEAADGPHAGCRDGLASDESQGLVDRPYPQAGLNGRLPEAHRRGDPGDRRGRERYHSGPRSQHPSC